MTTANGNGTTTALAVIENFQPAVLDQAAFMEEQIGRASCRERV